jgi:16S rRNA (cytosine967-C5)-methyltransferase
MQGQGELWATDAYPEKLDELAEQCKRLEYPMPRLLALDWTKGSSSLPGGFDRILLDAPCTGTGTLRRRPEIMLRLRETDPSRMSHLQETLLRNVAPKLAPEGRLVYAVCSVSKAETHEVLERVQDILVPTPFDTDLPTGLLESGQSTLLLTPLGHGTDGYFIASLRPKAPAA